MRLLLLFCLFLPTFAFSQSFPFDISFGKLYVGVYDTSGHESTSITVSKEYHYVSASFNGLDRLRCDFYNRGRLVDTLTLVMYRLEESRGVDFVEYKYMANPGNVVVFLRYSLYNVPGIIEVSIFENTLTNFIYIKDNGKKTQP